MSRCFLFVGIQIRGETSGCRSAEPQTVDRQYHGLWELLEELSPAQTEPTNTISVSNTIVRFTRANAIIVSPVPRVHSAHNPWSQTFGPTLGLIFDVDKTHTIALSPMWLDQRGGTPIVAFLWTGLNNHNSSVCVCVSACTYICVCMCVKPLSHGLTMLHCPSDSNSNLCKDSFFPSVSSSLLLLPPFFSLFYRVDSSHPASLVPLSPCSPPPSSLPVPYCQTVSIFCSVSPSVTPPRFSGSVCRPPTSAPLPHSRPVLISISSSHTLRSLRLFVVTRPYPCFHLTLSFPALFHVLALSVRLTPQVVKKQKEGKKSKTVNWFYRHSAIFCLPPALFLSSTGLKWMHKRRTA